MSQENIHSLVELVLRPVGIRNGMHIMQSSSPLRRVSRLLLASRAFRVSLVFLGALFVTSIEIAQAAQESEASGGFNKLSGSHLELITDLPLTNDLKELPKVFDAAIPLWKEIFDVSDNQVKDWVCQGHIMLDRARFEQAGMIPLHLPNFPYGFQYGNQIWVSEQQSAYYRRHLLLHEGTHWFMNRKYGNNAPPWLMEGIAEWLGTHSWNSVTGELQLGVVPNSKSEVPYWGRMKIIREALDEGTAPSIETIMRYGNSAHREVEAYAWSWAAVLFFREHPRSRATFQRLLEMPLRPDNSVTSWFYRQLQNEWPEIRAEWNALLTDLDYGYTATPGMLMISPKDVRSFPQRSEFILDPSRSWQASGFLVKPGEKIRVQAQGSVILSRTPRPWQSYADGVTLEYHRGQPLGRLTMIIAEPTTDPTQTSQRLEPIALGSDLEITAQNAGELHFRLNEPAKNLADNEGELRLVITRIQ